MSTTAPDTAFADPRDRPMNSWKSIVGALASRGETDSFRAREAQAALSWWRVQRTLGREVERGNLDNDVALMLLDQLRGVKNGPAPLP